jgi:hypothetical protein
MDLGPDKRRIIVYPVLDLDNFPHLGWQNSSTIWLQIEQADLSLMSALAILSA